ncbi:hypothetical protein IV48_GL001360 [Fructilactobacillus fructivorans]|nr:hypothetical protein IV51_GL001148 [Fructilactobacillus fructivorans]KRN42612.1 hypothetical protein IV48_GL001360 [Fructilactobacillus fructivorans]
MEVFIMAKHDKKDQIKNLLDLESDNGPVLTITVPLDPKEDNTRRDNTQINSLVDTAKKAFQKQYKPELWNAYDFQIKNYLKTLQPKSTIAKGIIMYVTNDSIEVAQLNYAPQTAFSFSDRLQILPIVRQYQFVPDFDMLFLQRDDFKVFHVNDLNVIDDDTDTPDPFNSDKTETETQDDPRKNGAKWDTHEYYELVDKYVQKHVSNKDHNPLVVVANAEDEGRFNRATHNPYVVEDKHVEMDAAVKNAGENVQEVAQTIHDNFVSDGEKSMKNVYDKADGAKKTTDDYDQILKAAIDDRIANLIIQQDAYVESKDNGEDVEVNSEGSRPANELNSLALTVLGLDGDVTVLPASDMPTDKKVSAILRW